MNKGVRERMESQPTWRIPISATLDRELIDRLDERAQEIGVSRSTLIRILLNQALKEQHPLSAA
jgi:metal-responsive CopG/Arc/MetJ family transcriptional regulator